MVSLVTNAQAAAKDSWLLRLLKSVLNTASIHRRFYHLIMTIILWRYEIKQFRKVSNNFKDMQALVFAHKRDQLHSGEILHVDDKLVSENGHYYAIL